MSRLLDISQADAITLGISSIIGAGIAFNTFKFVKRVLDNKQPTKWRKVGEISNLWCFPIKSCGPIVMKEFDCSILGPKSGQIRDRVFMVTRLDGEMVSSRTYPKMVLIAPKIEGNVLTLTAPDMPSFRVDIDKLHESRKMMKVKVWKDRFECVDCGDEAAKWFSKYISGTDEGFRLAFYPSSMPKPVVEDKKYLFEQAQPIDTGSLHDETSFMLMNQASFDDLNKKVEKPVGPLQYRPNLVVKGAKPWEEDNWRWVKIGGTVFRNVQPCIRCISTLVDPVAGTRDPHQQPLKTLNTFRKFEKIATNGPVFGIHLGLRGSPGSVKIGDEVLVAL